MRLLDRYLLRELLVPLFFCLAGFLLFWISSDLIAEIDEFQEYGMDPLDVAQYYIAKIPEFAVMILPIGLLLSLLFSVSNHARHNELIAMRAAGMTLWRISLPYFAVGLLLSLSSLALNELAVPEGARRAEQIINAKEGASAPESRWRQNIHFRNARDRRIWNIGAFHLDSNEMKDPHIEWIQANGAVRDLKARAAIRTNDVWVLHDVTETYYPGGDAYDHEQFEPRPSFAEVLVLPELTETPEEIKSQIKISGLSSVKAARKVQLSLKEIYDFLSLHPSLNARDRALLTTQLHARLAAPWTPLVVVLIALPFGARSGRRNIFMSVASSMALCFAFFILLKLGLALGTAGYVPGWLAAWIPNLLFGIVGAWLLHKTQ